MQRQWCYKGKPLYLFSGDANPGDNAGNGVDGLWKVATPDANAEMKKIEKEV